MPELKQRTVDAAMQRMVNMTELARRDKDQTLSSYPLTVTVPYDSEAMCTIKLAAAALGESLPNQQAERTRLAFRQLQAGVAALHLYLLANGLDV